MLDISGATRIFPVVGWPGVFSDALRALEAI
jgi:hypothetical protein